VTVLFWDIDGTLLTTARAGIAAWEGALAAVAGAERSLENFQTAGMTDTEIARRLLEHVAAPHDLVADMVTTYEDLLPGVLGHRRGSVLPNVVDILQALDGSHAVRTLLLTGNTRRGARAKLTHYGLDRFFVEGAYADDAGDRPGIARVALSRARAWVPDLDPDRAFVIGDTPADVACGRAIGVRTVAVATGVYGLEELAGSHPTLMFAQLPSPAEFAQAIGVSL
jgi:phosphoglycolate phosphatase-like HAD superfamily hydrolase